MPRVIAPKKRPRTESPPYRRQHPARLILALFLVCVGFTFVSSCSDDTSRLGPDVIRPRPEGESRALRIGFSTLPPEQSREAYIGAFATAAQYGDLVLIQRTPPWEDFLPGAQPSEALKETTRLETRLLDQYGNLQRFFAIDPTDGVVQRRRIANLPASIDPQVGFEDPDLREAFLAYMAYVVRNYDPDYLALGVEINMLAQRSPKQYEAFLSLYKEAYRRAKALSPDIRVFPTFQLEDLQGTLDQVHAPQWELLDAFRGVMDVLAISTYPYVAGLRSARDLPRDYYAQLKTHFAGEVIIAETAHPSAPVEGESIVGSEEDQEAYLANLLAEAEANGITAVIWLAALDPAFAGTGPASVFRDTGLRKSDGGNKLAWTAWEEWARRPLR